MRRRRRIVAGGIIFGVVLAGGTSFLAYPVITGGRAAAPVLQIHEPAAWAGARAAVIEVDAARAVSIGGVARHTGPITDVRLNGLRLARTAGPDGMAVEFSGFLNAEDVRDGTVVVEARGMGEALGTRRYTVRVSPGAGRGPSFDEVDRGDRSQRWAVVIGAGAFADPGIPPDPGAVADAEAIAQFLRSPAAGLGGFAPDHVRLITGHEATGRSIRSALKTFLRTATPADLVVVFVTGRAVRDPHRPDRLYLLAHDTDPRDIPATAVDLRFIAEAIEEVYGHTRLVVADLRGPADAADAAGAFLRDSTIARQGGLAVLTPAGAGAGAGGSFAEMLLEALNGGADRDGDGVVRLGELADGVGRQAATSYDRSWPLAQVATPRTALAAPAARPDR